MLRIKMGGECLNILSAKIIIDVVAFHLTENIEFESRNICISGC
ncbi:hypothetical protein yrohd0001_8400 [Yersinia rohdei ATCC 43380]|nr:hypothetical protein yrohd0001_8400 [Yersinia rohdei ATCC 43380]